MGAFSELSLEQQYPEAVDKSVSDEPVQATQPAQQAAAPFASPFISSGFSSSPFISAAPAQPVKEVITTAQPAASKSAAAEPPSSSIASPKEKAPQSVQNFAENAKADKTTDENEDEDAKRKAHEESEAKRKAEWEAKFAERRAKDQAERDRVTALSDDAVMQEAMKRVADGFERLTRRNMKDCVSEYIQTMCVSDPAFGRRVMDPKKEMTHCIWFINRKAQEYVEKELKDNGMKPERGIYGCDVPDDLVYQWAVEYFNDPNAKEDEREDEKFVPKPYYGKTTSSSTSKKKDKEKEKEKEKAKKEAEKKAAAKKAAEEKARKKETEGQMSLLGAVA